MQNDTDKIQRTNVRRFDANFPVERRSFTATYMIYCNMVSIPILNRCTYNFVKIGILCIVEEPPFYPVMLSKETILVCSSFKYLEV